MPPGAEPASRSYRTGHENATPGRRGLLGGVVAARLAHDTARWLPYAVSLLFHAALLAALLLLRTSHGSAGSAEPIIANAELLAAPGGVIYPDPPLPELNVPVSPQPLDVAPPRWDEPSELISVVATEDPTAGANLGAGIPAAGPLDVHDDLAGLPAAGPKAEFFGQEGTGYKIIYVVDRSGSMIDTFEAVKRELKRSIARLSHVQSFHIIFFSGGEPLEKPPKKFVRAIETRKNEAFRFLDRMVPVSEGGTDPTQAMRRAVQMQPDLIYLLSDGGFSPDLLVKLRRWNKDKAVRIFTIGYGFELEPGLLRRIAEENGGEYTLVPEDSLP